MDTVQANFPEGVGIFFVQAKHRETGAEAAAKIVDIRDDTELDDFMVEIDILAECQHKNVINLYEAYYFDNKLWVSLNGLLLDSLSWIIFVIGLNE